MALADRLGFYLVKFIHENFIRATFLNMGNYAILYNSKIEK